MKPNGLHPQPGRNPFASRFIRAGSMPFFFVGDESIETIHDRLLASQWRGQVLGPHGSGKTTLLRSLAHHWRSWGRQPVEITLHNGQRRLPNSPLVLHPSTQLIIDGFEQLSWFRRWALIKRCQRIRCGLLVSTHRALLPPTILETHTTVTLANQIVDYLIADESRPTPADVERSFCETRGNVREMLFKLYDVYQSEL